MADATTLLWYAAAFVIGVGAVGRLTRLFVDDDWPPIAWWRDRWDGWTGSNGWNPLFHCAFCLAPWIGLGWVAWAWLSDLHWSWWLASVWLAGSYAAAMLVARDIPSEDR